MIVAWLDPLTYRVAVTSEPGLLVLIALVVLAVATFLPPIRDLRAPAPLLAIVLAGFFATAIAISTEHWTIATGGAIVTLVGTAGVFAWWLIEWRRQRRQQPPSGPPSGSAGRHRA